MPHAAADSFPRGPLPTHASPQALQGPAGQSWDRGAVVAGYRLDAVIGHGPSGVVYNAWHSESRQAFAVKLLHPELLALTAALVRLRQDNRAIARLRHPHLTAGCAEVLLPDDGPPLLCRPLWAGEPLRARLGGPLPLSEVCRIFVALCGALELAHRNFVFHGDLKPENVLLLQAPTPTGLLEETVQVLDFGMHHLRHGQGGIGGHPLLGPVSYLAPEQIRGDEAAIDARTDVFALGALLYECLTGQVAFRGTSAAQVVTQICHGAPPRPSGVMVGLPPGLDEVVARACARDRDERPESARALWALLHEVVSSDEGVRDALRAEARESATSTTLSLLPSTGSVSTELSTAAVERALTVADLPAADPAATAGAIDPGFEARPLGALGRRRRRTGREAIAIYRDLERRGAPDLEDEDQARRRETALAAAEYLSSASRREGLRRQAPAPEETGADAAEDLRIEDDEVDAALALPSVPSLPALPALPSGPPRPERRSPPLGLTPPPERTTPSVPPRPERRSPPLGSTPPEGLGVLLGRARQVEALPPVLGLVGMQAREEAMRATTGPMPTVRAPAPDEEPLLALLSRLRDPLWPRLVPLFFGALLMVLALLLLR